MENTILPKACMEMNCLNAAFSSNLDDLEIKEKFCFEKYISSSVQTVQSSTSTSNATKETRR